MTFFSDEITATTSAQLVMANKPAIRKVVQIQVTIRSMGTATYVGLGGRDTQNKRLTVVGDNLSIDTPYGKRYLDLRSLFLSSDTADAVVEIIGDSYEGS